MNQELQDYLQSVKQYRQDYYSKNKDKITSSSKCYYQNNKEHCLERMKSYREQNKEILNDKKNAKHICECGASITLSNLAKHRKSQKHINFITKSSNS